MIAGCHTIGHRVRRNRVWVFVRLNQPDLAALVVLKQLAIVCRVHFSRPYDLGAIDIGRVINPFILRIVVGGVPHNGNLISGKALQFPKDIDASFPNTSGPNQLAFQVDEGHFGNERWSG